MQPNKMPDEINHDRRRFFGTAAMTLAAAQFALSSAASAQSGDTKPTLPAIKPGTNTSFGPLKQINAGVLNVGYAEAGPANGPVVILLHGWPYDIYSFVDVAPLAGAGRLSRDRPVCARLRYDAFSFRAKRCATASKRRSLSMSST